MTKIISVNAGSSSLKFQLFEMPEERVLTSGIVERIGFDDAYFTIKVDEEKVKNVLPIENHKEAVELLLKSLIKHNIVDDLEEITGVGHRVVHGGEYFDKTVLVDEDVISKVEELVDLAPLHNPANLIGYRSFKTALPNATQTFVFDTAFHQTIEPESYLYALPYDYYKDFKIRKYGFHGTSHMFVSREVAKLMNKSVEDLKIITCHLGNGASIAAIKDGKSINTSMGFTPLSGVMMGTRSGDVDAQIVPFLVDKLNLDCHGIVNILNKKSGMLGVSDISSDARDIEQAIEKGNERAILTRKMYANKIASYIGSYFVQLGGVDVIVFTAGLGENDGGVRADIMDLLKDSLGVVYNVEENRKRGQEVKLSTDDSKVEVWIVPTNEELVIAQDTYNLMK